MKKNFLLICFIWLGVIAALADNSLSVAYVSTTGSDSNAGTEQKPFRTIRKALDSTSDQALVVIRGGDYEESINISQKSTRKTLTIKSYSGERVRLLGGRRIDKGNKVAGYSKVLSASVELPCVSPHYKIFQHDVDDKSTKIIPEERHPLQRGKYYRCSSTPLNCVVSVEEVEQSKSPAYYYDATKKQLYFSIEEGTTLAENPLYLPCGKGVYGGNHAIDLSIIGIEVLYAPFDLSRCSGARIMDCAAMYAFAGGGFMYHMSTGIEFIRCEAARSFTESGNGDGFNGHAHLLPGNHPMAKHTSVSLIDCWAHDNYDDGYSNHERCEGLVRGGLFEYNGKFGVNGGYGGHESAFGVIARHNRYGFAVCANVLEGEGGYASQMFVHNCIAEQNREAGYMVNTSERVGENRNRMVLYDCYSLHNKIGFESQDDSRLELFNCMDYGSEIPSKGEVLIYDISPMSPQ